MKNKYIAFGMFIAFALIFWNFLDVLLSALISHTAYVFEPVRGLIMPLVTALAVGYFTILRRFDD